ncbi:MAG: hypothetical protein ABIC91_04485 [Nanoarchaeota archaeon]|nr:hypothetical protein [Nanoarchaeota archaeon]MBU1849768.1 hypothetical protein [Nanoarchaeota archaeon]
MTIEIKKRDLVIGNSVIETTTEHIPETKERIEYLEKIIQETSKKELLPYEEKIINTLKAELLEKKYHTINFEFLKESNEVQIENKIILLPKYAIFSINNLSDFYIQYRSRGIEHINCPHDFRNHIMQGTEFYKARLEYDLSPTFSNYNYKFKRVPKALKQKYSSLKPREFRIHFKKLIPEKIKQELLKIQPIDEMHLKPYIVIEPKLEDWNNEDYQTKNAAIILKQNSYQAIYINHFDPIDIKL